MQIQMKIIARIRSDYKEKFGIPRQSGLADGCEARIVFEPEYRREEAVRGLEGFTHIWLLWEFSETKSEGWHPTVRPPRLGGNVRVGVFATRSPFRPNPIGLSSVRLLRIDRSSPKSPVLVVSGADLLDGTPIYDIKPYLREFDSHPDAVSGFADDVPFEKLRVVTPDGVLDAIPEDKREALLSSLACDPRPQYKDGGAHVYGLLFGGFDVKFKVEGDVLTVLSAAQSEDSSGSH